MATSLHLDPRSTIVQQAMGKKFVKKQSLVKSPEPIPWFDLPQFLKCSEKCRKCILVSKALDGEGPDKNSTKLDEIKRDEYNHEGNRVSITSNFSEYLCQKDNVHDMESYTDSYKINKNFMLDGLRDDLVENMPDANTVDSSECDADRFIESLKVSNFERKVESRVTRGRGRGRAEITGRL